MPILVISATGDEFFAPDDSYEYFDKLVVSQIYLVSFFHDFREIINIYDFFQTRSIQLVKVFCKLCQVRTRENNSSSTAVFYFYIIQNSSYSRALSSNDEKLPATKSELGAICARKR